VPSCRRSELGEKWDHICIINDVAIVDGGARILKNWVDFREAL
jgi:hypothetical protein